MKPLRCRLTLHKWGKWTPWLVNWWRQCYLCGKSQRGADIDF